jgi:ACR3 family arsenite transporter
MIGKLLSALGGQGPALLVASLCVGLISHPLAHFGYGLLPVSAFLLTLGSFLAAGLAPSEIRIRPALVALALAWVGFVLPLTASALLWFIPIDPALRAGVLLSLLAPPVGSAAAIAAMLGLQSRVALIVSIALTLIAPLSIPAFAAALGLGVAFDMQALTLRLFTIIGAAALVAFASVKFRGRLSAILPNQRAATGVAVIGLIIVGLATSKGIEVQLSSNPTRFAEMLAAAVATNFGLCALGLVVFWKLGHRLAGTIGLVSGNRNVTLAWAAASFGLPQLAEGYVAACVIPVLALPLIITLCVRILSLFGRLLPFPATVRSL